MVPPPMQSEETQHGDLAAGRVIGFYRTLHASRVNSLLCYGIMALQLNLETAL